MSSIDLSIVVPMYNEQEVIDAFFVEIRKVMEKLPKYTYEIVCVNDGSKDNTLDILKQYAKKDKRIKIISFSRNFHKEIAVTAGMDFAAGDSVIVMDADLQHPVELIPEFIKKWEEGYKVVYGVKKERKVDSFIKRFTANLFYKVYNKITQSNMPRNASDYILFDRQAVDTLKKYREKNRFMRILFYNIGYKHCNLEYAVKERAAGNTKWNYWKLWNFALDGITSSTTILLRIWTYLGALIAFVSFVYGMYIILRTLIYGTAVPGYASLLTLILFFGGTQLLVLGIFGEYIGRIFTEVKNRPLYIIDEKINLD